MVNLALVLAAGAAVIGFAGLIYGATGQSDDRRKRGLRLCQVGMSVGGLLLIAVGVVSPDTSDVAFGFLLLVFGTGVTAIGRKGDQRPRNG